MNYPSGQSEITLGDFVAMTFDQVDQVTHRPERSAELATLLVLNRLARSPRNASVARQLLGEPPLQPSTPEEDRAAAAAS